MIRHLLITLLGLLSFTATSDQTFTGKVIRISDGDTVKVLVKNKQLKIRLAEIDTPERDQPYGNKAKQALGNLIFGKAVTVQQIDTDRYKRIAGKVYLGNQYVNAWMVENGLAWVYRKYSKDPNLIKLEKDARRDNLGL